MAAGDPALSARRFMQSLQCHEAEKHEGRGAYKNDTSTVSTCTASHGGNAIHFSLTPSLPRALRAHKQSTEARSATAQTSDWHKAR